MTDKTYKEIIKEAQEYIIRLAKKNGWMWFYKMHQTEMVCEAEKLLTLYPKADKKIVIIACWLHDNAHYPARNGDEIIAVKKNHHIISARQAEEILKKYKLEEKEVRAIINCILCHRNTAPYRAGTLEEKIVAVADTLSHFTSIFYLTYFKFHPEKTLEQMVAEDLAKLERDWDDLSLLPKARSLVKREFEVLNKLLKNYKK